MAVSIYSKLATFEAKGQDQPKVGCSISVQLVFNDLVVSFRAFTRYDIVFALGLERVVWLAPDADDTARYWAVTDADQCIWHEKFDSGDEDLLLEHDPYNLDDDDDDDDDDDENGELMSDDEEEGEEEEEYDSEPDDRDMDEMLDDMC